VIEISEPPDTKACASCMSALDWVYHHRLGRWYAITKHLEDPDPMVVRIHDCPLPGVPRDWRSVKRQPPEVTRRGIRRARMVAAKAKSSIEEKGLNP
jgi:hypothetical protein